MPTPPTPEDLIPLRENFIDREGNPCAEPAPHTAFLIVGGPWPQPGKHAFAEACSICGALVAIRRKSYDWHHQAPQLRPILCTDCYLNLQRLMDLLQEASSERPN